MLNFWLDRHWCGVEHRTGRYGIKLVFKTMRFNAWCWAKDEYDITFDHKGQGHG